MAVEYVELHLHLQQLHGNNIQLSTVQTHHSNITRNNSDQTLCVPVFACAHGHTHMCNLMPTLQRNSYLPLQSHAVVLYDEVLKKRSMFLFNYFIAKRLPTI